MDTKSVITCIWHGRTLAEHSDIYLKYVMERVGVSQRMTEINFKQHFALSMLIELMIIMSWQKF
jgi:hypothetical protein